MQFSEPLIPGRLRRRYKRFLADVELADGRVTTVHCPNTGSLMGCMEPGARVWMSRSANVKRKYPLTWELVEMKNGTLVGIHTGRTNWLVKEGIEKGIISELQGYDSLRREVRLGDANSRIDLLLEKFADRAPCFVEVKNVTAAVTAGIALFPDAVTVRGTRHLRDLAKAVTFGSRAVILYCIQRNDVTEVRPADTIDPEYGKTLRKAVDEGVEPLAYRARITLKSIELETAVPVVCPG